MSKKKTIMLIGGAGYVGAMLAKKLLKDEYRVKIFDIFIYKSDLESQKNLDLIRGDIRDFKLLEKSLNGVDYVIHLACISNDPSFELNPELGKSINFDPFESLIKICIKKNIKRFIYASSSSVYGLSESQNVDEDHPMKPLTDYSKFKLECEKILQRYKNENLMWTVIRPATVCGYSTRQRFDVVVNLLTNLAVNKGELSVFGGDQLRPNVNINDMIRSYVSVLEAKENDVKFETFNVGYENLRVIQIAELVRETINKKINLKIVPTDDNRSYHISSSKIKDKLNFEMQHTVKDAIIDLLKAFDENKFSDSLNNPDYFNIKKMQLLNLS